MGKAAEGNGGLSKERAAQNLPMKYYLISQLSMELLRRLCRS